MRAQQKQVIIATLERIRADLLSLSAESGYGSELSEAGVLHTLEHLALETLDDAIQSVERTTSEETRKEA